MLDRAVKVDMVPEEILPAERHRFASSASCPEEERIERFVHGIFDRLNERIEFIRCPDIHFFLLFFGLFECLQNNRHVLTAVNGRIEGENASDVLHSRVHRSYCKTAHFEPRTPFYEVRLHYPVYRSVPEVLEVHLNERLFLLPCPF